jgi:hypothetical protein
MAGLWLALEIAVSNKLFTRVLRCDKGIIANAFAYATKSYVLGCRVSCDIISSSSTEATHWKHASVPCVTMGSEGLEEEVDVVRAKSAVF